MQIQRQYGEEVITLDVEPEGEGWRVRLPDGSEHRFTVVRRVDDVLQIAVMDTAPTALDTEETAGQRVFRVPFARSAEGTMFAYEGMTYAFQSPSVRASKQKKAADSGLLTAPMSGVVADVLVTEGQSVAAYQPLVVLEAMKVMTTLEAPFAGTVAALSVQKKQQIALGATVVEITPLPIENEPSVAKEHE